jgi:hypothetical protein
MIGMATLHRGKQKTEKFCEARKQTRDSQYSVEAKNVLMPLLLVLASYGA